MTTDEMAGHINRLDGCIYGLLIGNFITLFFILHWAVNPMAEKVAELESRIAHAESLLPERLSLPKEAE